MHLSALRQYGIDVRHASRSHFNQFHIVRKFFDFEVVSAPVSLLKGNTGSTSASHSSGVKAAPEEAAVAETGMRNYWWFPSTPE
jgi:hypothetical protein